MKQLSKKQCLEMIYDLDIMDDAAGRRLRQHIQVLIHRAYREGA